jgi:methyl-accepting chemotaxis protein
MKRKFFQVLLMGAVTVSLGMFVSCKDTNEDLYRQLELQIDGNTTVTSAIQQELDALKQYKDQLEAWKATVKSCHCNDNGFMDDLKDFMQKMSNAGFTDATQQQLSNMMDIEKFMGDVINNYTSITEYFTTTGVTMHELDSVSDMLNKKINDIEKCKCDLEKLALIEQTANEAHTWAEQAKNNIETLTNTVNGVKNIANSANDLAHRADSVAKKAEQDAATAQNNAAAAQKDAEAAKKVADAAQTLAHHADSVANDADKLSKENKLAIDGIKTQLNTMSARLDSTYTTANEAFAQATTNKLLIDSLAGVTYRDSVALEELKKTTDKIPGMEHSIDSLFDKVDSLRQAVDDWKPEVAKLYDYADAKLTQAKAYTDLEIALLRAEFANELSSMSSSINNEISNINVSIQDLRDYLDTQVDDLWDEIEKLQKKDLELDQKYTGLSDNLAAYKDSTDTKINDALADIVKLKKAEAEIRDSLEILDAKIDGNTIKIGQLKDTLDSVAVALDDKIEALKNDVDSIALEVAQNQIDIATLFGEVDTIKENLKRMVTGIIVQSTFNPAFGSISLPANLQTNVLLTYFGEANYNIEFPSADPTKSHYLDDRKALTTKDMEMITQSGGNFAPVAFNSGDKILQNETNNAGTLYVTINPNTVDFTGLDALKIVNSQDTESYIKLGELTPSNRKLEFGAFYSRADNGFYECTANLAPEDVDKVQKINFNTASIKDAIKEIVNKRSSADPKKIAQDLVDVIKGFRMDANAIKCSWKEADETTTHSVYSNYNLAATALKPLSLTTMKNANYKTIPGYERAMSLLDSLANEAKNKVHVVFKDLNNNTLIKKIVNLQIKSISVPDLSDDLLEEFILHMDTTFIMDGLSYTLDLHETVNVPVKFSQDVTVPINIDKEVAIDLSNVLVETPTIVVTTDVTNSSGGAQLVVPVKDTDNKLIGNAYVDLDDIEVDANASIEGGTIKLNGQAVAHIEYNQNQVVTVSVDKTFPATFDFTKTLYFGDNGTDQKSFNLVFNYDMRKSAIDLWGVAQNSLGDVNNMLDDIRDIISEANTALDKINSYEEKIDKTIDNYVDKVASYIKKINEKIVNFVNNTNSRLQPTLICSDGKGTKMLSSAKNNPTKMKAGEFTFIPTTWSLELVVPLAKKHVAVTDVIKDNNSAKGGNSDCLTELKRVNGSDSEYMNVVLSGDKRRVFANLKSGYKYEIAYSALDFHGNVSSRKYYILVTK